MSNIKSPAPLFLGIFVLALISVAGLWIAAKRLGAPNNLDLGKIFVDIPADSIKLLYGAETENGIVAEFFAPSTKHKFGLAQASSSRGGFPPLTELLSKVIEYQGARTVPAGTNPFLLKFTGAQFDGRRAYSVQVHEMPSEDALRPAKVLSFVTNRGANYAVTVLQDSATITVVIAMLKDSPVDLAALGSFLALLRSSPAPSTQ